MEAESARGQWWAESPSACRSGVGRQTHWLGLVRRLPESLLHLVQLPGSQGSPSPGEAPPPTRPGVEAGSGANEEAEAWGGQLSRLGPVAGEPTALEPQVKVLLTLGELGVVPAQAGDRLLSL